MDTTSREPYPSDLTDGEWAIIEPLLPPPVPAGAPRKVNLREVINAIYYVLTTGCAWKALPHDFLTPEGTVRDYFHQWRRSGRWQPIHDTLRSRVREAAGKDAQPSAGSIDSQTVKATRTSGQRGYDAGKKINGVKRHILVDTLGLLLAVVVHAANIQDRDGAKLVFAKAKLSGPWPRLKRVWADSGYAGKLIAWVDSCCQWILEIVKRNDDVKGFKLLPKRWVVERTFSWLSNCRRLSKHYEYWNETAETMVQVALGRISRGLPPFRRLRELMDEVYRPFDRRCRMATALAKLAVLRSRLRRFKRLRSVLERLLSPSLEKALVFLDEQLMGATSNAVERGNWRYRKMQKTLYRVRTQEAIEGRLAMDLRRESQAQGRAGTTKTLHRARAA